MASRKQKERRGDQKKNLTFQVMPSVTYFLQRGSIPEKTIKSGSHACNLSTQETEAEDYKFQAST
jgi:hypothetical protein